MYSKLNQLGLRMLPTWLYQILIGHWDAAGLKKYATNTGWIFFARLSMMALSLLTTLFIARNLGPTNYGELSYAVSFVAMFSFIAALGIDSVLYRELIKHPESRSELMGTALILKIVAAIFTSCLTVLVAYTLSPADVSFWLITTLSLTFVFQSFYIINYEFQAAVKAKAFSLASILITLILCLLKVTVVYFGNGVIYLTAILVLESILLASSYLYLQTKYFTSIKNWTFSKTRAVSILRDSWPFIFSSGFAVVYARIDQIMLKNLIDATAVGVYDAAVRLTEIWYFIPTIIISSLFPALVNAKQHSGITYSDRIKKLLLLILGISVCISVLTVFSADLIVSLIFGSGFVNTATVLKIYIWSLVPLSLVTLFNHLLLAENAKVLLFSSAMLGMVTNIIGNYLLIPQYQATGAAAATIISSFTIVTYLSIGFFFTRRKQTTNVQ